jgi:hypothetical protein
LFNDLARTTNAAAALLRAMSGLLLGAAALTGVVVITLGAVR